MGVAEEPFPSPRFPHAGLLPRETNLRLREPQ